FRISTSSYSHSSLCNLLVFVYSLTRRHIVFLNVYHSHLALLSFPTRRSSDLRTRRPPRGSAPDGTAPPRGRGPPGGGPARSRDRSEEHTSELQSRENLVCRLLLEKKKDQIKLHTS